jgi:hypothetical protein
MEQTSMTAVELSPSDPAELSALGRFLELAAPDAEVARVAGEPAPGEQGFLDVLRILADSTVLLAAVRTLPEFLRSRRPGLTVTVKAKGKSFSVSGRSDEVMLVLDRLLDD